MVKTSVPIFIILISLGMIFPCRSEDKQGTVPSSEEIIARAKQAYALLTSYSDEGTIIDVFGKTTSPFTIKLARPNYYRVELINPKPSMIFRSRSKITWSGATGDGAFIDVGLGVEDYSGHLKGDASPNRRERMGQAEREATLGAGVFATQIPCIFFNVLTRSNALNQRVLNKLSDENIGDVLCYVIVTANSDLGGTTTLWIGQRDFLIHQIRRAASVSEQEMAWKNIIQNHPEAFHGGDPMEGLQRHDVDETETHTNIMLNPKLPSTAFDR